MNDVERLDALRFGSRSLRVAVEPLWEELPDPPTLRAVAVRGFASIVRQHTASQWLLVQAELDLSATALVRPAYEALVRAIWTQAGADDPWIEGFFHPSPEAIGSDAETRMGPNVPHMLEVIKRHHPEHVVAPLLALKEATWRAMHSFVHGGIRPVVQSYVPFPAREAGSLLINSNGMLLLATNVVRMSHGLSSAQLETIVRQHADCVPVAAEVG